MKIYLKLILHLIFKLKHNFIFNLTKSQYEHLWIKYKKHIKYKSSNK